MDEGGALVVAHTAGRPALLEGAGPAVSQGAQAGVGGGAAGEDLTSLVAAEK